MDTWLLAVLAFVVSALLVGGGILAALGQFGSALRWVRQRLWPRPPARIKFQALGGRVSRSTDINNQFAGWNFVRPDLGVRNDGPAALYEVDVGAIDPRGTGERVVHPARVQRLAGEGTEHRLDNFGRDRLDIPPDWLDDYDGQEPHKQVAYFIAATDEHDRRWETTCRADPADDWVPLTFSRA